MYPLYCNSDDNSIFTTYIFFLSHGCVFVFFRHNLFNFNVVSILFVFVSTAYCEDRDSLQNLCSLIPGDAQQYSLFRSDAAPVECPFRGSYTFTYSRGHGECRSPVSRLDSCTESWRTFFRYQACPDVQGTESSGTAHCPLYIFIIFPCLAVVFGFSINILACE